MPSAKVEQRATYTALSGVFMSLFAAFAMRKSDKLKFKPFDLAQMGFAVYRLGRMVAYDKVFETYRLPFAATVKDPTGAGETVVPRGRGAQRALGELIACPICTGTWISAGLVYGLTIVPDATRTFLAITSAVGVAELLNAATEAMQWAGESERFEVGEYSRARQAQR